MPPASSQQATTANGLSWSWQPLTSIKVRIFGNMHITCVCLHQDRFWS